MSVRSVSEQPAEVWEDEQRGRVSGAFSSRPEAGGTDFWAQLANARTSDQLCQAWLGILCEWIPGTQAGLLILHDEADRYAPAAVWPDPERDMSHLADVAQQALSDRRGVVQEEGGLAQYAYPLLSADLTYGVVVLLMAAQDGKGTREALRLLHWGAGWLVGLFDRRQVVDAGQRLERSGLLQDLLLGVQAERQPEVAARWVVNRLAEGLPCRQAMLGFSHGEKLEVVSISGSAGFESRSNLLSAAREAMREALDAGETCDHPEAGEASLLPASAIAEYCQEADAAAALCLPLTHRGRQVGALLLDFAMPVSPAMREFAQTLAWSLAPCIDLQRTAARGLAEHARDDFLAGLEWLLGPRRPGWKLVGILAMLALLLASLVDVDYRVRSPATVEGEVQRAVVAPFDGFIQQGLVRAGDRVKKGQVMARLDDRDLRLEEAKGAAEADLADRRLRQAMAKDDAVAVRLAQAESAQAHAELDLVREKLARVILVAPFDGRVVKGDLSQQLGAPVEQGKLLFELAPLDAYRVVLRVDERDILHLREGQSGELLLAGLPGERFRIRVNKVAPVAQAEEGVNAFRVEAAVQGRGERIQPGMEGVGKVIAGERSLLWIWFHRITDWLRYTAWTLGL